MTGLNVDHFRSYVVTPTLRYLEPQIPYTLAAEQLVLGTALVESNLRWLAQAPHGPALGVFQMEPATHSDCWTNWLLAKAQDALRLKVMAVAGYWPLRDAQLQTNLSYATIMCRVRYRRAPGMLPAANDWPNLAAYWVRYYNAGGAGTVEHFLTAAKDGGLL